MLFIPALILIAGCSFPCYGQEPVKLGDDDLRLPCGLTLKAQKFSNDELNDNFVEDIDKLQKDLQEIKEVAELLGWEIKIQGESLDQVEDNTDHSLKTLESTNEILTETKETAKKNSFLSFLIKDGVSFGAGAGMSSLSFFGTKSLLMLAPVLPTAPAIAIPLTTAVVIGGVTYLVSRYQLGKVI